jgi:hypothetical protein
MGAALGVTTLLVACTSSEGAPERSGGAVDDDGPVTFVGDSQAISTAGIHADAGQRVVFGATVVQNDADTEATLLDASLVDASGRAVSTPHRTPADSARTRERAPTGVRLVQTRVKDLGTAPGETVGAAIWPFEDYGVQSTALPGFRMKPGTDAELLFVMKVDETGTWHWPTTRLRYEVDGSQYETSTSFGFIVCPRAVDSCDVPR